MNQTPSQKKQNSEPGKISSQKGIPQGKRKFFRSSDIDQTHLDSEDYDDTQRKGLKEWDEQYQEFDEEDLGKDFGKP
ncbi:MAG: hypothetical protein ACXVCP_10205 [Bdellovibrio sp.]